LGPGPDPFKILIRLSDDGTGALPLLRHIILENSKSSTYKLALLRVLARIANSSLGLVRADEDEFVQVPLGLVALYWLRQFKPLLKAELPQMPTHGQALKGLGFEERPDLWLFADFDLDRHCHLVRHDRPAGHCHSHLHDHHRCRCRHFCGESEVIA
jgi:hypothetical protein